MSGCEYFRIYIIFPVLLFLLLELFFQPTPQLTSMISLGAALCMGAGIMLGTKTVYEKQMHINDKGWKNGASSDIPIKKKPSKKKKTPKQEKPLSDKYKFTYIWS